ncbi:hypothetical protein [Geodermatophilus sp. URMC 63]
MSAAVSSRAAVVFRSPQDVEVCVDGGWAPGAMLGWRHDERGGCQAQVRWRDGGEPTWVDLAGVRLPERHLSLAHTGTPAESPTADTGDRDRQDGSPRPDATVVMAAVQPARRTFRAGRRHGADGTAEQPAVGSAAAGRHRAPADGSAGAGRHRALTAEMSAVAVGTPAVPDGSGASAGSSAASSAEVGEPDLLTRPIRLNDLASHPRGGRPAVRRPV